MGLACHILCVEDLEQDVETVQRVLAECVGILAHCHLHVMADGEMAMRFLRREEPFGAAPRPSIILLDLKLPGAFSGLDVLRWVKGDPVLASIPVMILTGSTSSADRDKAKRAEADGFFVKPTSLSEVREMAQTLDVYWSEIVKRTTEVPVPAGRS